MYTDKLKMIVIAAALIASCGKKESDGGKVKVLMSDGTSSSLFLSDEGEWVELADIATLKMAPLAMRISKDNAGGYMVWGAANCPGTEGVHGIDDTDYKYFSEHECKTHSDNSFLNLLDEAGVNDTLNSQEWPVPPGDYHYVSLIMCHQSEGGEANVGNGEDNFVYQAGGMSVDEAVSMCDPYTGYSATPITVTDGGSLTINLTYDLNRLIDKLEYGEGYEGAEEGPHGGNCYETLEGVAGAQYCPKTGQEAFTPSIQ